MDANSLNAEQREIYESQLALVDELTALARKRYSRFRLSKDEIRSSMHELYYETCSMYNPAVKPPDQFAFFLRYRYARCARRMLLAAARGMTVGAVRYQLANRKHHLTPISIESLRPEDYDDTDLSPASPPTPEEHTIEQGEIIEYINAKLQLFGPITAEALRIVLGLSNKTIRQLGKDTGFSEAWIGCIAKRAVVRFRKLLVHDYPEWGDAVGSPVSLIWNKIKKKPRHVRKRIRDRSKKALGSTPRRD